MICMIWNMMKEKIQISKIIKFNQFLKIKRNSKKNLKNKVSHRLKHMKNKNMLKFIQTNNPKQPLNQNLHR